MAPRVQATSFRLQSKFMMKGPVQANNVNENLF